MPLPSWAHWYKKPSYIDIKVYGAKLNSYAERSSPRSSFSSTRPKTDVPKKLSLERILENRTCSPMSLYDFYMYLKYIEHSSENLEFYAWLVLSYSYLPLSFPSPSPSSPLPLPFPSTLLLSPPSLRTKQKQEIETPSKLC